MATALELLNPNTTLAAETGHNSSGAANYNAANFPANFTGTSTLNTSGGTFVVDSSLFDDSENPAAPACVSDRSIHEMFPNLPAGTPIFAHVTPWAGSSGHRSWGYTDNSTTQVQKHVNEMIRRGFDGAILDWHGTGTNSGGTSSGRTAIHNACLKWKTVIEALPAGTSFKFVIMLDGGAINSASPQTDLVNAINAASTNFAGSSRYYKVGTQPVLMFFNALNKSGVTPSTAKTSTSSTNFYWIDQNYTALANSYIDAAYSWQSAFTDSTSTVPANHASDPYNTNYWNTFYNQLTGTYSTRKYALSVRPHFNGTLTDLTSWSEGKYIPHDWGKGWKTLCDFVNNHLTTDGRLLFIQPVTWNDYEEGSILELGIENGISVTPTVTENLLTWSISGGTGDETTIHHYDVLASLDDTNYAVIGTVNAGSPRSLNLSGLLGTRLTYDTSYKIRVKTVGISQVRNKMSAAVSWSIAAPTPTVPTPVVITTSGPTTPVVTVTPQKAAKKASANPVPPPPRPPVTGDRTIDSHFQQLHKWMDAIYRKTGKASEVAPISVEGTATTITGELEPEQLAAPIPVEKGGTGATTAEAAIQNLNIQTAIDPGTAGFVPVSNGSGYISRKLGRDDIEGIPLTQGKSGINLTAASGASVGDFGDTLIVWDVPFDDANYTLTFNVIPTAGVPIPSIVSKSAANCTVRITNATAVQSDGTGEVIGVHF